MIEFIYCRMIQCIYYKSRKMHNYEYFIYIYETHIIQSLSNYRNYKQEKKERENY